MIGVAQDLHADDTAQAQTQSAPAGAGSPIPGSAAADGWGPRPHSTPDALSFVYDPNLSDLERIDATIAYRKAAGEDQLPNCFYGPVERRISGERLVELSHQFAYIQRSEAWKLLLAEPEDPNAAPVKIAIRGKNGPNCPERDMNERLQEQRQQLLEKEQQAGGAKSATTPLPDPQGITEIPPSPVSIQYYSRDISELQRIDAIIRGRASSGKDQRNDCYYGPVVLRIPSSRLEELAKAFPLHTGEEDWVMLMAEPQDPNAQRLTYIVKSGSGPGCPAGDIDARLREERQRLLDEKSAN